MAVTRKKTSWNMLSSFAMVVVAGCAYRLYRGYSKLMTMDLKEKLASSCLAGEKGPLKNIRLSEKPVFSKKDSLHLLAYRNQKRFGLR
jgi:hypothetical protein